MPNAQRRPNVLLIMVDMMRWDAFGRAGAFPVETPSLDRLATEGVWFRQAHCQAPICVASRSSFLTGRYVHQTGCTGNTTHLWPEAPSFVRALRDVGYVTANVGKLHFTWRHDMEMLISQVVLRDLGFDDPLETTGKMSQGNLRASPYTEHLRQKGLLEAFHRDLLRRADRGPLHSYDLRPSILHPDDHIDGWVLDRAAAWLERSDQAQPFFLWVGPPGPHDPFDPPEPYASLYQPDAMPLGPLDASSALHCPSTTDLLAAQPETIQAMRTQYLGNVRLIDDGIGRLLSLLEARGMLEDTWIVFTSDHGEMLGDHRLLTQCVFFEPMLRVPLLIRPPRGTGARRGVVVDTAVELLDVTATLVELAGAQLPGQQGRSLLPLIQHDANEEPFHDAVVSQLGDRLMVKDETWKLVVDAHTLAPQGFWDLATDPDENVNTVAEPAAANQVRYGQEWLQRFLRDTPSDLPEPWCSHTPAAQWPRNPIKELIQKWV